MRNALTALLSFVIAGFFVPFVFFFPRLSFFTSVENISANNRQNRTEKIILRHVCARPRLPRISILMEVHGGLRTRCVRFSGI